MISHRRLPDNDCELDRQLPIIWDDDFPYGPRTASGEAAMFCDFTVSRHEGQLWVNLRRPAIITAPRVYFQQQKCLPMASTAG